MPPNTTCTHDSECTTPSMQVCVSGYCRHTDGRCANAADCDTWFCRAVQGEQLGACMTREEAEDALANVGQCNAFEGNDCQDVCAKETRKQPMLDSSCEQWYCKNEGFLEKQCEIGRRGTP